MNLINFCFLIFPLLGPAFFLRLASPVIQKDFLHICIISCIGFFGTVWLIPIMSKYTVKKMYGLDINKKGTPEGEVKIPESLGIASGIIYLTCCVILIYDNYTLLLLSTQYNAALLTICFMILLGFVDDTLDIPWRYKLMIPAIATLPILFAYNGETTIIVPPLITKILGIPRLLDLGILYYVYMGLCMIFCSNAINIHAGINGLEAGQSFIIAIFILIHNIIESGQDPEGRLQHTLSMYLVTPFIATTAGLLLFNWYPSKVFVGDTFTMSSGMTLAVTGCLGHFSKTLLIFFIPQILNFIYSIPQLFNLWGYTCPRHRLPFYNTKTKKLEGIKDNLNLVNGFLVFFGPMTEKMLCVYLLVFQTICCIMGLFIRYRLSKYLY